MPEESGGRGGGPPDAVTSGTGTQGQRNSGRNRGRRQAQQTRFEGRCQDLKKHAYDISQVASNYELFANTTRAIGEYASTSYENAGEFRNGLVDLELPALIAPVPPLSLIHI